MRTVKIRHRARLLSKRSLPLASPQEVDRSAEAPGYLSYATAESSSSLISPCSV
jgi:hypothetical protein